MGRSVIVLRECERVGDLVAILKGTTHNGFPIVEGGEVGGDEQESTFFTGLILRRQLLVLVRERVWRMQEAGVYQLPPPVRTRFIDSAFAASTEKVMRMKLTAAERDAKIDLRPFMDPSPYVVNEIMPLRRIYRLFNEIGVRHLVVVDCREQVVGIITRKDILPETIERNLLSDNNLTEFKALIQDGDSKKLVDRMADSGNLRQKTRTRHDSLIRTLRDGEEKGSPRFMAPRKV